MIIFLAIGIGINTYRYGHLSFDQRGLTGLIGIIILFAGPVSLLLTKTTWSAVLNFIEVSAQAVLLIVDIPIFFVKHPEMAPGMTLFGLFYAVLAAQGWRTIQAARFLSRSTVV